MIAKFIGQNSSLGLEHGKTYNIVATKKFKRYNIGIEIYENHNNPQPAPKYCCYDTFEGLLANWEMEK